jgi:predicted 2-oxoglutarate/Fe(II)-dependent dioxygenase YbiX/peroxiredoxin
MPVVPAFSWVHALADWVKSMIGRRIRGGLFRRGAPARCILAQPSGAGGAAADRSGAAWMTEARDESYALVTRGDRVPRLAQRAEGLPELVIDTMAGRYIVLCFYASAGDETGRGALDAMLVHRDRFDDRRASFCGISADPQDESLGRVRGSLPGVRFIWDFDLQLARLLGAAPSRPPRAGEAVTFRRFWLVIDPTLHVLAAFPFAQGKADHGQVFAFLDSLPDPGRFAGFDLPVPILVLPSVLEPELCRRLIDLYEEHGGTESGIFTGDNKLAPELKRRKDYKVVDPAVRTVLQACIQRRVSPEIERLFFMRITRIERYIVGCYAAEDGGHFKPHRDNGRALTDHRRFAVSVNLNDDFEGGELTFPEYSPRAFKSPPGWATVFPCAILHRVLPVRAGRRFAFLPFLYDEAGAAIRAANLEARAAGGEA